jgi:hypothetical protein
VHLCTISAFRPAMMQLRTYTVRFCTLGPFGARMMQKCTAPCSPQCRSSTRRALRRSPTAPTTRRRSVTA